MKQLSMADKLKKLRGSLSHREFGKKVGLSDASLIYYEQEKMHPKFDKLKKIADACGVGIEYFYEGIGSIKVVEAPPIKLVTIPLVMPVSAGITDLQDEFTNAPKLMLPTDNIFKDVKGCIAFQIEGDSMEPLYREGDILIVKDRGSMPPKNQHTYVVEWEEGEKIYRAVKNVIILDKGFMLTSKNIKHRPKVIDQPRKFYRIVLEITRFHDDRA